MVEKRKNTFIILSLIIAEIYGIFFIMIKTVTFDYKYVLFNLRKYTPIFFLSVPLSLLHKGYKNYILKSWWEHCILD